jgi:hypothetical protein
MSRHTFVAILCATCLAMATVGYAASFTLTTTKLGAASVSTPIMFPDSVSTTNAGPNIGKIEKNDTITFVWSRVINQPTLCSGWSNAQSTHSVNMSWSIQNNAGATGNDVLVPGTTPTCTAGLDVGAVDLGSPLYVGSNGSANNNTTTVTVGATTTTLTMKWAGNPSGAPAKVTNGSAGTWTPDSSVQDMSGNNCGSNIAQTNETNLF